MAADHAAAFQLSYKSLAAKPEESVLKSECCDVWDVWEHPEIHLQHHPSLIKNVRKLVCRPSDLLQWTDCGLDLSKVEELNISGNTLIDGLHDGIRRLVGLKKLDVSGCGLTVIPNWIRHLVTLEELNMRKNYLFEGLCAGIGPLVVLKKLDVSGCAITSIPDWICNLDALEELDISRNSFLGGVHADIGRLVGLKKLGISGCCLSVIPDWIRNLDALEELDISRNSLKNILHPDIGGLVKLKKLDISLCDLTVIPDWISKLVVLEDLNISGNKLMNGLCDGIRRLVGLKKLDTSGCGLTVIPRWIRNLLALEELDISRNSLTNILHADIGQLVELKKLDISGCDLTVIPDWISKLVVVEELNISGNRLIDGLHDGIRQLVGLKKLDVSGCGLTVVPYWIRHLVALEELNISGNKFTDGLHGDIGLLVGLKKLDISGCGLTVIPDWISNLVSLWCLNIGGNKIDRFPNFVLSMKNLTYLDVSNDYLEAKEGKESGNRITQLPVELTFTSLLVLRLDGNPVTEPPKEIWSQGLKAIKTFMQALLPGGEFMRADTINMIGDTDSGKTSIAKSLVARSPRTTKAANRTRVLQQFRMPIDVGSGQAVNINDFGGHEIYHSVLPIFLPNSALLILAYNMTKDWQELEHSVRKWLYTALAKSSEYRIIIVGTHADKIEDSGRRSDMKDKMKNFSLKLLKEVRTEVDAHLSSIECRDDKSSMQHTLEKLRGLKDKLKSADLHVVTLSCRESNNGLSELIQLVEKLLCKPATLPVSWCRAINAIFDGNAADIFIAKAKVEDICRKHFNTDYDDNAVTVLLQYLVKTSQILWFEDHPRLRNFIFHSPQRIVDTCKAILHHNNEASALRALHEKDMQEYQSGKLREYLLKGLLKEHEDSLPDRKDRAERRRSPTFGVVLDFLQNFNLISCVATKADGKHFVIPSKLSPDEPPSSVDIQESRKKYPSTVTVSLSFLGALVPLSYFETSLASMLAVAASFESPFVLPWKHGLIVISGNVYFLAKLGKGRIDLTAFSKSPTSSPWTLLEPMLRRLNDNAGTSWHGAPPSFFIKCQSCARQCQDNALLSTVGELETDFSILASAEKRSSSSLMCKKCALVIPLCFLTTSLGEAAAFPHEITSETTHLSDRDLRMQFRGKSQKIIEQLTKEGATTLARKLRDFGLLTDAETEKICHKLCTDTEAAQHLMDIVLKKDDIRTYRHFVSILHEDLKQIELLATIFNGN